MDREITWVYACATVALVIMGVVAAVRHSVYLFDAVVGIVGLRLLYTYRSGLILSWEGALLAVTGFLMNVAGVLGAYTLSYNGVGWDKLLHVIAMAGGAILVYAYLQRRIGGVPLVLVVFCVCVGLGALNEVTEFLGTYYLGVNEGILGLGNTSSALNDLQRYDTYWDLIANMVGILAGIIYSTLKNGIKKKKK